MPITRSTFSFPSAKTRCTQNWLRSKDLLRKSLDSEYEKLHNRFDKLVGDDDKNAEGIRIIKEKLIQMYTGSCKDAAYFSPNLKMRDLYTKCLRALLLKTSCYLPK